MVVGADCDRWPFLATQSIEPIAIADFDAYVHPYAAFLAFWGNAPKTRRLLLFFTDGHRQGVKRTGTLHRPDGVREVYPDLNARRRVYNFYWRQVIEPWFGMVTTGWRVIRAQKYLRKDMLYWGALIEEEDHEPDRN
jgi:hypothetical protein